LLDVAAILDAVLVGMLVSLRGDVAAHETTDDGESEKEGKHSWSGHH
jgi:hypothetical protein